MESQHIKLMSVRSKAVGVEGWWGPGPCLFSLPIDCTGNLDFPGIQGSEGPT